MTNQPHSDGEMLLERVAIGDLSPTAPAVAARAASDPGFARRLADLLAIQGQLDRDAAMEREVLAEALGSWHAISDRRWRRRLLLLAAALLTTAILTFWPRPGVTDPTRLGNGVEAHFERTDQGALRLRWTDSLRPGDYYVAAILRAADGSEIARSQGQLLTTEWFIPESARLPAQVRVEITTLDSAGLQQAVTRKVLDVPH